jgi:DNA-binding MarR family transcriptional regulator
MKLIRRKQARKTPRPGIRPPSRLVLDRFLPYRLSILSNRVSGAIARVYARRFGIAMAEWRVVAVLGQAEPLSAGGVGRRTLMDKVQVSRAVARLLALGLVRRRVPADDRRRTVLSLTPAGRRVYAAVTPVARATEAALLSALDRDERRALDALLTKLQARADRLDAVGLAPV